MATGGTPLTTGVISGSGYDHALSPAGSLCKTKGAPIILDGAIDRSDGSSSAIDTSKLPLDPLHGCTLVFPHDLLHVNNIFEIIKATGDRTAWAGESESLTDLYRGPSGNGLDQACVFEQFRSTDSVADSLANDERRVTALMHWIEAKDCTGKIDAPVPELFGMSFTSVSAAQTAKAWDI